MNATIILLITKTSINPSFDRKVENDRFYNLTRSALRRKTFIDAHSLRKQLNWQIAIHAE
jgi:hypothetical protein